MDQGLVIADIVTDMAMKTVNMVLVLELIIIVVLEVVLVTDLMVVNHIMDLEDLNLQMAWL